VGTFRAAATSDANATVVNPANGIPNFKCLIWIRVGAVHSDHWSAGSRFATPLRVLSGRVSLEHGTVLPLVFVQGLFSSVDGSLAPPLQVPHRHTVAHSIIFDFK
jgi:hypothetical protein